MAYSTTLTSVKTLEWSEDEGTGTAVIDVDTNSLTGYDLFDANYTPLLRNDLTRDELLFIRNVLTDLITETTPL